MPKLQTPRQGKKRTRNGKEKPPTPPPNETPTCAQPPRPSISTVDPSTSSAPSRPEPPQSKNKPSSHSKAQSKPSFSSTRPAQKKHKMPRLPPNATVHKRALHHPAIPTPHTSSASPKSLYLTASSPYIPTIKRIRSLLAAISQRSTQSSAAHFNNLRSTGRLSHQEIERAIADGHTGSGAALGGTGGVGGSGAGNKKEKECVYIKATGRAIPRALEIGVHFLREKDCAVRVSTGSVRTVDDIEVADDGNANSIPEKEKEKGDQEEDEDMVDADAATGQKEKGDKAAAVEGKEGGVAAPEKRKRKKSKKVMAQEDIPETRIRTLSTVTVSISLV